MIVRAIRTRIFKEQEDLEAFIAQHIRKLPEKSVLVVTSKVVGLSEGRTADPEDIERIVREESEFAVDTKYVWLTIRDGIVMASAGADLSNGNGRLVLLPKDCMRAAEVLRKKLCKRYKIRNLGIVISDSRTFPLRAGVSAMALGYAGIKGVRDYRGKKDIFGRKFEYARTNVVDSLASVAALEMGEGKEQQPLALITDAYVEFTNRVPKNEVKIPLEDDIFRPLFAKISQYK